MFALYLPTMCQFQLSHLICLTTVSAYAYWALLRYYYGLPDVFLDSEINVIATKICVTPLAEANW